MLAGHSLEPLCQLSMRRVYERGLISEAVPFTDAMRNQRGTKINCIPFTLSPLAVFTAIRRFLQHGRLGKITLKNRPANEYITTSDMVRCSSVHASGHALIVVS